MKCLPRSRSSAGSLQLIELYEKTERGIHWVIKASNEGSLTCSFSPRSINIRSAGSDCSCLGFWWARGPWSASSVYLLLKHDSICVLRVQMLSLAFNQIQAVKDNKWPFFFLFSRGITFQMIAQTDSNHRPIQSLLCSMGKSKLNDLCKIDSNAKIFSLLHSKAESFHYSVAWLSLNTLSCSQIN